MILLPICKFAQSFLDDQTDRIFDRYINENDFCYLRYNYIYLMHRTIHHPFGMLMPERNETYGNGSLDYRYAYNGMEVDNEMSGNGNSYTTEFRQYDPRLGRWKSLDPLMAKYPMMSPYTAFNNNPVYFIDPLGLEGITHDDPPKQTGDKKKGRLGGFFKGKANGHQEFYEVKVSPTFLQKLKAFVKRNAKKIGGVLMSRAPRNSGGRRNSRYISRTGRTSRAYLGTTHNYRFIARNSSQRRSREINSRSESTSRNDDPYKNPAYQTTKLYGQYKRLRSFFEDNTKDLIDNLEGDVTVTENDYHNQSEDKRQDFTEMHISSSNDRDKYDLLVNQYQETFNKIKDDILINMGYVEKDNDCVPCKPKIANDISDEVHDSVNNVVKMLIGPSPAELFQSGIKESGDTQYSRIGIFETVLRSN